MKSIFLNFLLWRCSCLLRVFCFTHFFWAGRWLNGKGLYKQIFDFDMRHSNANLRLVGPSYKKRWPHFSVSVWKGYHRSWNTVTNKERYSFSTIEGPSSTLRSIISVSIPLHRRWSEPVQTSAARRAVACHLHASALFRSRHTSAWVLRPWFIVVLLIIMPFVRLLPCYNEFKLLADVALRAYHELWNLNTRGSVLSEPLRELNCSVARKCRRSYNTSHNYAGRSHFDN